MSDRLNDQIRDYFAQVDAEQGAVDVESLIHGQPLQTLQPVAPPTRRWSGWTVSLAAAAVVTAIVLVPLLFMALGDEPEVATTVPETTLPPPETTLPPETTVVTTTVPEAATTTEATTPTTVVEPAQGLVLDGNGIGVARFGDDEEAVIAAATAILGEPWSDEGYVPRGLDGYCGGSELSRIVTWGDPSLEPEGGTFHLTFVREPIRTIAGDMTGFVAYSSSASFVAGDGSGVVETPYPWLPGMDGLGLLDDEATAVELFKDRLSDPTPDEDDGIAPIVVSRNLTLDGPWPINIGFWDGAVHTIGSGPCPINGGLELDGRGIGLARFGDDPENVIAAVSQVLGPPTEDTGFVDPVELQVIGFCGGANQRSVSWGDFSLGFIDQEYSGYSGLIAYSMSAIEVVDGEFVVNEDPWPLVTLPQGVRPLHTEEWARIQFEDNLSEVFTTESGDRVAWLDLEQTPWTSDRSGPWPIGLAFGEEGTDRITRVSSTGCGE